MHSRLVDRSNQREEGVQRWMMRVVIAVLDAGHSQRLVRQVVQRAKNEVLFKIEKAREEVLKWSHGRRQRFKEEYDGMTRRERAAVMEAWKSDRS